MKMLTTPSPTKNMIGKYSKESVYTQEVSQEKYKGITNWQSYCCYINDVLRQIRLGHKDYCYFTYQIEDLLKFEKDRLVTKYYPNDGYWEVWLNF